ncbi:hypothetical protein [Edaphovirga cremea]|uniref:hypothetical protein n=1 Tax=Edaphovirga cremea TaxID=2267246 RepID=UPI001B880DED|nr:hypothetical protein [Edaphovirga cremea]
MARESDIRPAFVKAISRDSKGHLIVTTGAFQKELDDVNHVWTIRYYQTFFYYQDGETIDGEGLEGVVVLGKVTVTVLAVYEPYRSTH